MLGGIGIYSNFGAPFVHSLWLTSERVDQLLLVKN